MVNEFFITIDREQLQPLLKSIESANLRSRGEWDCSGQVKLATVFDSFQYCRSDLFGVRPPLY